MIRFLFLLAPEAHADGGAWREEADGRATVERIELPQESEWTRVTTSSAAVRERHGVEEPLWSGTELHAGDRVITRGARVRLRLHGAGHVVVEAGSSFTLGERGLLYEVGTLLLDVRGLFAVQLGEVELGVEGTRFVVAGERGAPVRVTVARGVVTLSRGDERVRVSPGQTSVIQQAAGAPMLAQPADAARLVGLGRSLDGGQWGRWGEPVVTLGALGGASLWGEPNGSVRLHARVQLLPAVELTVATGITTDGERLHLPQQLGAAWELGPVAVGGAALAAVGPDDGGCDPGPAALRGGGAGTLRGRVAMSDALALEAEAVAGWLDPHPFVAVFAGVTLAL